MWDSVPEFGRECAVPPAGFTGDVKEWQSKLTDEEVVKNIQEKYPGLHPVIKTLAWDFRTATLKTIPNPGTLARIRSWLEHQKEVVFAHSSSQVPMKFCFCIILCEKKIQTFLLTFLGASVWRTQVREVQFSVHRHLQGSPLVQQNRPGVLGVSCHGGNDGLPQHCQHDP